MFGPDRFCFLNEPGQLVRPEDWNDPSRDKLWLYNLHYFDDLNAEGAEQRQRWHEKLIRRWIEENPPAKGNGWEPYPISLRVVNWIKWDLRHSALDELALESLALQLRWLRRRLEHHLRGNHLLANAKALIYGGLYFQGAEADEWLRTGMSLLQRELDEQVLPDGGHIERSPMYHLIVLEDLLDLINISRANDPDVPADWLAKASQMLNWAAVMRHPDGEIPFFNDAAFKVAGRFDEIAAYAARLGIDWDPYSDSGVWLNPSGYVRLANEDAVLFFDVGPVGPDYLPGHAHADTLSLELSLFGQRVLVNSGTSLYGAGPERQRQRGTDAHNTVMVDEQDSSEVWGGFRVARRARIREITCNVQDGVVVAEHDGYCRLPGRPVHRRQVQLSEGALTITDTVSGAHIHHIQGAWHFHPDINVMSSGYSSDAGFMLEVPAGDKVRKVMLTVQGPVMLKIEECTWHPEFGRSLRNRRLVFQYHGPLPVMVTTHLRWR